MHHLYVMTRKNALTFRLLSYLLEEAAPSNGSITYLPSAMTSIQFFYSRDFPGNALRTNARQALAHLGMDVEIQETEAAPEQAGCTLPALAIDGEIAVSGVEPSVRELELLFEDRERMQEESCGACGTGCGGMNCGEGCSGCGKNGESSGMAGRIIGFVILLIILFTAAKILS